MEPQPKTAQDIAIMLSWFIKTNSLVCVCTCVWACACACIHACMHVMNKTEQFTAWSVHSHRLLSNQPANQSTSENLRKIPKFPPLRASRRWPRKQKFTRTSSIRSSASALLLTCKHNAQDYTKKVEPITHPPQILPRKRRSHHQASTSCVKKMHNSLLIHHTFHHYN